MWLLFFLSLAILGRGVSISEFIFGRKAKETKGKGKISKFKLPASNIASGSITMVCGCKMSREEVTPCQGHRALASAEGN